MMELSGNQISEVNGQDRTDAVSTAETLTSLEASINLPASGSETDFGEDKDEDLEDLVDGLVEKQFSSPEESHVKDGEVEVWLDRAGSSGVSSVEDNMFDSAGIEKMAITLCEAALDDDNFTASAWETDQTVPECDFENSYKRACKEKLPLHLMEIIKILCSSSASTVLFQEKRALHIEILKQAVLFMMNSKLERGERKTVDDINKMIKPADEATLRRHPNFYAEFKAKFKPATVPKTVMPLVQSVETLVNNSIQDAYERSSAILFTDFASIPKVVGECSKKKSLEHDPYRIGKYVFRLQKRVSSELTFRCLVVLAKLGFPLRPEFIEEDALNVSIAMTLSSQGSHVDEEETGAGGASSQSSILSASEDELIGFSFRSDDEDNSDFNPADSPEVARDDDEGNSPLSSQGSWNGYTPSPPLMQYSLPERERSPIIIRQDYGDEQTQQLDGGFLNETVIFDMAFNNASGSDSDGSQEEGPSRRRRRLN